mmetsp:Transcript_13311/g.22607  ORF Transcript_13311/g.22607 Transcript_13311/m.22607 type:complete len:110 (-) Transcript_13311:1105-1434(-)
MAKGKGLDIFQVPDHNPFDRKFVLRAKQLKFDDEENYRDLPLIFNNSIPLSNVTLDLGPIKSKKEKEEIQESIEKKVNMIEKEEEEYKGWLLKMKTQKARQEFDEMEEM